MRQASLPPRVSQATGGISMRITLESRDYFQVVPVIRAMTLKSVGTHGSHHRWPHRVFLIARSRRTAAEMSAIGTTGSHKGGRAK